MGSPAIPLAAGPLHGRYVKGFSQCWSRIATRAADVADPMEHLRQRVIARVRQIIDDHRAAGVGPDALLTCSCGAEGLTDHPGHVAERVVDGLAIKPDIDKAKKRIRYASAWFDWELTQLEGAEC